MWVDCGQEQRKDVTYVTLMPRVIRLQAVTANENVCEYVNHSITPGAPTALLCPDERLLASADSVGICQGCVARLCTFPGKAHLSTLRLFYLDNADPTASFALQGSNCPKSPSPTTTLASSPRPPRSHSISAAFSLLSIRGSVVC
jgi:hypothetical protein